MRTMYLVRRSIQLQLQLCGWKGFRLRVPGKTYDVRADLASGNSVHGDHLCGIV